jgi:phage terminase large subunit GpA-like protein
MPSDAHLASLFSELADIFDPPLRLTVSEAAEAFRYLNNPGSYVGPWRNAETPYLVEPANSLRSRLLSSVVFVGPAQCGKTDGLILNWIVHMAMVAAGDLIIYSPTGAMAKDFSIRRIGRMLRHSESVGAQLLKEASADNLFDKQFRNGSMLSLSWPTATQFAGRPVMRCALTDYDRMANDIEGEGAPFDLAMKRNTTFGSFGMTLAESSPSREITNPRWVAASPHEAPPCEGILGLYNRGDRRRRYWRCTRCEGWFQPTFKTLEWDPSDYVSEAAASTRMICPLCGHRIDFRERDSLMASARWLRDGEKMIGGWLTGTPRPASIASFWMFGPEARFTTWAKMVEKYLLAEKEVEQTGSEDALRTFWNTDAGEPYVSKKQQNQRLPEVIKSRAEFLSEREVPEGVRFLLAVIDVQANRFEVQIFGILAGEPFDTVLIDSFPIVKSERDDDDGDRLWVKPATYLEDWFLLVDQVIQRSYPLAGDSSRRMRVKAVACDSGGPAGATTLAYEFWRRLRADGLAGRFQLVKGESKPGAPRARIGYPDATRKDKLTAARGDVPVLFLNSNTMKDMLAGRLECVEPGRGMFRVPAWLPDSYYTQLCAEVRTEKGWENPGRYRNEAWDLGYYMLGLAVSPLISAEKLDWSNPPGWAATWDKNDLVFVAGNDSFAPERKPAYDFRGLGQSLAGMDRR